MIGAAARLLARHGLEGTSFSTVLAESGAPRGSIYHHFPDGKDQLVREAVVVVGARFQTYVDGLTCATPTEAVREVTAVWRDVLERSDATSGCAIAAVAVAGDEGPRAATGAVFAAWQASIAALLQRSGLTAKMAAAVAPIMIAAIEGALVMSRAQASLTPFDDVAVQLERLVDPPS
jgi:AcrR family transcriptional regulator